MRLTITASILLFAPWLAPAHSALGQSTPSQSPTYTRCLNRAGASTVQQGMCAQAELTRQDARLNHAYDRLVARYPAGAPRRIELRDSERAWLTHRDETCRHDSDTIDNACLITETSIRATELERQAAQP